MIKNNTTIKSITLTYIISLIPLILYGLYKNGIDLYLKDLVSIYGAIKPLLFIILGALIGIIVNVIYEKIIKKNKISIIDSIFSSFHMLYGILIACIISINTNMFLFTIVTFIVLLISKFLKNKINYISLSALIIFLIMSIFNKFSFLNIYEATKSFNLNTIDYLFGKGSGGIITTNIIFICIGFIYLYFKDFYKKNIAIYSSVFFAISSLIYLIVTKDIGNIFNMLFTNGILFSFIYIAPELVSSSYTKEGQVIYGVLVGIVTFLLYLINPSLSSLGSILIISILNGLIDLKFE